MKINLKYKSKMILEIKRKFNDALDSIARGEELEIFLRTNYKAHAI